MITLMVDFIGIAILLQLRVFDALSDSFMVLTTSLQFSRKDHLNFFTLPVFVFLFVVVWIMKGLCFL